MTDKGIDKGKACYACQNMEAYWAAKKQAEMEEERERLLAAQRGPLHAEEGSEEETAGSREETEVTSAG